MKWRVFEFGLASIAVLFAAVTPAAFPQQNELGSIEFLVSASPAGGRSQSAPRLPIFLLRKSYAEIQVEAEKETPAPDQTAFIESLDVSTELKEWMKKKKNVRLYGQDFIRSISNEDILGIPEFWEAYLTRNGQDVTVGFPRAKFKETDPEKNPAAYDKERSEYKAKVLKYLQAYQHSKEGIDLHLTEKDAGTRWARAETDRQAEIARKTMLLAQSRYLVAKTETDLQGRGGFVRVTPGSMWLSTLDYEAIAGDARLRWDVPIVVRAGASSQVELNNVNASPRIRK